MSSSRPRPMSNNLHHREIRSTPDEAEPSFSYEQESFMASTQDRNHEGADDVEDEFHRRLAQQQSGQRRESSGSHSGGGSSFWRSSTDGPSFSSANLNSSSHTVTATNTSTNTNTSNHTKNTSSNYNHSTTNNNNSSNSNTSTNNSNSSRKADATTARERKTSGLLGAALQSHALSEGGTLHESWNSGNGNNMKNNSNSGEPLHIRHRDSSSSLEAKKKDKKEGSKHRAGERRLKMESQTSEVEIGHIIEDADTAFDTDNFNNHHSSPNFGGVSHVSSSLDRSSSDQSTGSLLYGKTPNNSVFLGKSSSLIFPTGIEAGGGRSGSSHGGGSNDKGVYSEADNLKRRKINLLLDQCESVRFLKKKLVLSNLGLSAADIPVADLCGTPLGNALHKLSLAGNRLVSVPAKLVQSLPTLKHLDLSQCELHQLPDQWNLPQLKRLNLSHNRLTEFPEEGMLIGLPDLIELNMYGNKVAEIIIPHNPTILTKLETLNLGYNDLAYLPDDLDQLKALRTLKVMNNFLEKVPMRVCDMDLRAIDVSSNPVIQPPIETCERGICGMKRYYQCLKMEEQSKRKALEEARKKAQQRQQKKEPKRKTTVGAGVGGLMKSWTKPLSKASPPDKKMDSSGSTLPLVPSSLRTSQESMSSINSPVTSSRKSYMLHTELPAGISEGSLEKAGLMSQSLVESAEARTSATSIPRDVVIETPDEVAVNDTLKVIFVGMAMVGKTSMIQRLIEGKDAVIPTHDERTVGVDIYEWEPKKDKRFEHIDSRIQFQDKDLAATCGDVDIKFSVWDFAGQHVYHATHELFFSPRALYVLVWDMGATNKDTHRRKSNVAEESGAFKLSYDSSDDEEEENEDDGNYFAAEEEAIRADRALEHDIDAKVQFWIDCIQSSAPGAAILPVASFADYFVNDGGEAEAKRRCSILQQRLLKHEQRRIEGIKERLKVYHDQNRANDQAAIRLRKLLCSYVRPKLIFGEEQSVVRVSGTQYTGFDLLTEKIVAIATGRDKGKWRYPIFHGHVGARIPRMRLEVRAVVQTMRDRFKVVEWGYFINQLSDSGLTSEEDISDALHFLTNIGELSYFGGVMARFQQMQNPLKDGVEENACSSFKAHTDVEKRASTASEDDDDMDVDDERAVLSMEDTSITAPSTEDGSLTTVEDMMSNGLSQFVFLNPRWLVAAVACILRHDLDREIKETRRIAAGKNRVLHSTSFYDAQLNCPVITADDACLLWQAKRITKKAADRAQEYSNDMTVTPFEFLQMLLIRFGVFVPIDLSIDKACLGGKEYSQDCDDMGERTPADEVDETPEEITVELSSEEQARKSKFFFLPSLLGPGEPSEAWTYKSTDSWKTTLCHSILFPDGVPPGLMERLTASVLSAIYAVANRKESNLCKDHLGHDVATYEGQLSVKEILCWRTAFFIKLGTQVPSSNGEQKESMVEIFTHLADRNSPLCVGSDYMGVGSRRLIISGRGQIGDGGRKIWKGGYLLVCKSIRRVMDAYGGLEYEKQGFCPDCLAKKPVKEAGSWDYAVLRAAALKSEATLRCQHGHRVDTRLVAGPVDGAQKSKVDVFSEPDGVGVGVDSSVPVQDLLKSVVLVGLWDGKTGKVVRVGSGFVADRKRGLIVTASHTLMNIWGDRNTPFGENYYGLRKGKVVIGVIPRNDESGSASGRDKAVFRYFAKIVAKDPGMDNGECHLDACVLQITTRMEKDVGGNGEGCGDQPEKLLLNNPDALRREKLQALKITDRCELDEHVRILGYNQGGEGLLGPGESLNRYVDFARGYVCMRFASSEENGGSTNKNRFIPREEVAVICPTIGGHSGGPCVNQQGEVIGILSRADPADNQRCYISPTSEWQALLRQAKKGI